MMPWPLFYRFKANGAKLMWAIGHDEPTDDILREQKEILEEWDIAEKKGLTAPTWPDFTFLHSRKL